MKICVTVLEEDEKTAVDSRFGRASVFAFVDLKTKNIEFIVNPYLNSSGGAGIQSAQYVLLKEVAAVVTGHVGVNAFKTLQAGGVPVYRGAEGSLMDVIKAYESGLLTLADQADAKKV